MSAGVGDGKRSEAVAVPSRGIRAPREKTFYASAMAVFGCQVKRRIAVRVLRLHRVTFIDEEVNQRGVSEPRGNVENGTGFPLPARPGFAMFEQQGDEFTVPQFYGDVQRAVSRIIPVLGARAGSQQRARTFRALLLDGDLQRRLSIDSRRIQASGRFTDETL